MTTDTPTDAATVDEEIILGVDTHNDAHVAAVITVLGALVGTRLYSPPPPVVTSNHGT